MILSDEVHCSQYRSVKDGWKFYTTWVVKLRPGAQPNTDLSGQFRKPSTMLESGDHDNGLRRLGPKRARRRDLAYIDELIRENERLLSSEFLVPVLNNSIFSERLLCDFVQYDS